jgi:hypothetical protein
MSYAQIERREKVDSWLLVAGSQTVSRPFQWHQEHPNARCFGPWCRALNIQESRKTPNLQLFQVLGFTPTLGQSGVATKSRWTPKISESDCRGQTSMSCGIFYINGKILKRRCLKWARIAHSDIWNTSYGQKKGRESNCQFDSRPQKVKNRPDLLSCRGRATYRWKGLNESYNFALDALRSEVFSQSYGAPKLQESHLAQFRDSHSRVPGKIAIWM